jgi:ketosteroid isomerase-like protein
MSQADIQALRRAFEDVGRQGPEALAQLLDPQVEWFGIRQGPWDCHDREQVLRTIREQLTPGVATRVEELVEAGDKVVVGLRSRRPGEDEEPPFYRVLTLRSGKIVRMQDCPDRTSAFETAGLAA